MPGWKRPDEGPKTTNEYFADKYPDRWVDTPEGPQARDREGWKYADQYDNKGPIEQKPMFTDWQQPQQPSYWENPAHVTNFYNLMNASPGTAPQLDWLDADQINIAYDLFNQANGGTNPIEWKPLKPDDMGLQFLRSLPAPPPEWLADNEQYYRANQSLTPQPANFATMGMTPQQWDETPWGTRFLMSIFQGQYGAGLSGAASGVLPGAVEGGLSGAASGGVGGAIGGALAGAGVAGGLGYALGSLAEKAPWLVPIMDALDAPAEAIERFAGTVTLLGAGALGGLEKGITGKTSLPESAWSVLKNIDAAWKASHLTYDVVEKDAIITDQQGNRVKLDPNEVGLDALIEAYDRIIKDETPEDVFNDIQGRMGFSGQMRDMVLHMFADPLNFAGLVAVKAGAPLAKLAGADDLADIMKASSKFSRINPETGKKVINAGTGLVEVMQEYMTQLKSSTDIEGLSTAPPIKRWLAGVTDDARVHSQLNPNERITPWGTITLSDPTAKRLKVADQIVGTAAVGGFGAVVGSFLGPGGMIAGGIGGALLSRSKGLDFSYLTHMTPISRAVEAGNNAGLYAAELLDMSGDSAQSMTSAFKALANQPYDLAAKINMESLKSANAAPMLLAARDFTKKADAHLAAYLSTEKQRGILRDIGGMLGKTGTEVLNDLAEPNRAEVIIRQIVDAPEDINGIKALVESGELNAGSLADMFKMFTKDGSDMPHNLEKWKAQFYVSFMDHVDEWLADAYKVEPEPTIFRLSKSVKAAQSLVLLGLNPTYMLNNVINNTVTTAATGVFGLRGPERIKKIYDRWGYKNPRFTEGVGPAGVDLEIRFEAVRKAANAGDKIDAATRMFSNLTEKYGIMSKGSAVMESFASEQAALAATMQYYGRHWVEGGAIPEMPTALKDALGPELAGRVNEAVRGSVNFGEIQNKLFGEMTYKSIDAFIPDMAAEFKMTQGDIKDLLHNTGIYDVIAEGLAEARDPDDVYSVFKKVDDHMRQVLDEAHVENLKYRAGQASASTIAEGAQQALEIYQDAELDFAMEWVQHWYDLDHAFEIAATQKPDIARRIIGDALDAEQARFRRVWERQQASYLGIAEGLGIDNKFSQSLVGGIKDISDIWKDFYNERRRRWDKYGELDPWDYEGRNRVRNQINVDLEKLYLEALGKEAAAQKRMDDAFVELFAGKYGDDAGLAAAEWRKGAADIRKNMGDIMTEHRNSVKGLSQNEANKMWLDFNKRFRSEIVDRARYNVEGAAELFKGTKGKRTQEATPPPPGPPPLRPSERANIARRYAFEIGKIASGNAIGQDRHILNAIKKYGEALGLDVDGYTRLEDVDPEIARLAFEERDRIKAAGEQDPVGDLPTVQDKVDEIQEKITKVIIQRENLRKGISQVESILDNPDLARSAEEIRTRFVESANNIFGEEQTAQVMEIIDAHARWYEREYSKNWWEKWKTELHQSRYETKDSTLYVYYNQDAKGAVSHLDDGLAIVHAFETADTSTLVHEVGHIFRRDLTVADAATVKDWINSSIEWGDTELGKFTGVEYDEATGRFIGTDDSVDMAEEFFARGFERYLAEGEAPVPALTKVFNSMKNWLISIYTSIRGSDIDIPVSDDIRKVFDSILDKDAEASRSTLKEPPQGDTPENVPGIENVQQDPLQRLINNISEQAKERKDAWEETKKITTEEQTQITEEWIRRIWEGDPEKGKEGVDLEKAASDAAKITEEMNLKEKAAALKGKKAEAEATPDPFSAEALGKLYLDRYGEEHLARADQIKQAYERYNKPTRELEPWERGAMADVAKGMLGELDTLVYEKPSYGKDAAGEFFYNKGGGSADWYKELYDQGFRRPQVIKGLRKIIAGGDTSYKYESALRGIIVDRLLGERSFDAPPNPAVLLSVGRIDEAKAAFGAYMDAGYFNTAGEAAMQAITGTPEMFDHLLELWASDPNTKIKTFFQMSPPTDTQNFSNWFRQSHATDDAGEPLLLYHGSQSIGFDTFDMSKADNNALFGPGFYFTDNPAVASGYANSTNNAGLVPNMNINNGTPISAEQSKIVIDRIIELNDLTIEDMARRATEDGKKFWISTGEVDGRKYIDFDGSYNGLVRYGGEYNWLITDLLSYVRDKGGIDEQVKNIIDTGEQFNAFMQAMNDAGVEVKPSEYQPGIIQGYMSIQNPFDMDKLYTAEEANYIVGTPTFHSNVTGEHIWKDLQAREYQNGALMANRRLLQLGYDGITHVGGGRFNPSDPTRHRVYIAFYPEQIKSKFNAGNFDFNNRNILMQWNKTEGGAMRILDVDNDGIIYYQTDDGKVHASPIGEDPDPASLAPGATRADEPQAAVMSEIKEQGYYENVEPIVKTLQNKFLSGEGKIGASFKDANLGTDVMNDLQGWLSGEVAGRQADAKITAMKWGENRRDAALLNYQKRYGFDNVLNMVLPYQFWYTRSAMQWAMRSIDHPRWLAWWARMRSEQNKGERQQGFPSRLNSKIRIPAPWLPEWAGDSLYIDPLRQGFPLDQLISPFRQMADIQTQEERRAVYILQSMVAEEKITTEDMNDAIVNKDTKAWSQALSQAKVELDSDLSNPFDYMSILNGPMLPLSIAYDWVKGKPDEISQLPMTRFIQTLTAWAKPGGINIEAPLRNALDMPEGGPYWDFYIERQISNLAATGQITAEEAKLALVEKSGRAWELATDQVGKMQAAKSWGSSIGLDFFPGGEQRQRELQQLYNQAIQQGKLAEFYDKYPEYAVRTEAMRNWENPDERMRSYLRSQLWDLYEKMPKLEQYALRDQDQDFAKLFLSKETRDYDAIPTDKLAVWVRQMGGTIPENYQGGFGAPVDMPEMSDTDLYQWYYTYKNNTWPGIGDIQSLYYSTDDKDYRKKILDQFPQLKDYWTWNRWAKEQYPRIEELTNYNPIPETVIPFEALSPMLNQALMTHYIVGSRLGPGTRQELYRVWNEHDRPGGSFNEFLQLLRRQYAGDN